MQVTESFLCTGITSVILNWSGTHPLLKERLKINSKGHDMQVFNSFSRHTGMLKGPEALDEFRLVISFSISTAETGKSIKLFACEGPRKSRGSIST